MKKISKNWFNNFLNFAKLLFIILITLIVMAKYLLASELIFLQFNEHAQLNVSNNEKIWIENKKYIQVTDQQKFLQIIGKSKGNCQIQIGSRSIQIVVGSQHDKFNFNKLKSILRFTPWLQLSFDGINVVVEGQIKSTQDWQNLIDLKLSNWILNAEVDSKIIDFIEYKLNQKLQMNHLQEVKILNTPTPTVKVSKDIADKNITFMSIIKQFGLKVDKDDNILNLEPLVRVKMTLAEVRKKDLENFGFKFPNEYSTTILSTRGADAIKQGWDSSVNLNLKERNGFGKILATPVLLSKSGSEANFLAGGEFPIKMITPKSHEVIWKKYGIQLKVKPTVDSYGHIKMDIDTEVSSLDHTQAVDGIPALLTNKIQASFDLQKSQTLILSGLIKHVDEKTIEGWPGLIHVPILGQLFSSHDYQQNKTEMIVFVTPEILEN